MPDTNEDAGKRGRAAEQSLGDHDQERRRVCEPHHLVNVAGWFDAPSRALDPFVSSGPCGLHQHRNEHDDEQDDQHARAKSQSPARQTIC